MKVVAYHQILVFKPELTDDLTMIQKMQLNFISLKMFHVYKFIIGARPPQNQEEPNIM